MQLFEMQGLLAGKCLPGDMLVGESLSQYFLRQFNQRDELAAKLEIVNGLMDAATELNNLAKENVIALQAKCDALAAENACLKQDIDTIAEMMETGTDGALFSAIDEAVSLNTPATDSVLARIKAQGVEIYKAKCLQSIERTKLTLEPEHRELAEQMLLGIVDGCDVVAKELRDGTLPEKFAANLRAGRKG